MRSARAHKVKLLGLSQSLLKLDKSRLSGRDKLYIQAIDELTCVANQILHEFKTIFGQVLKDAGNGRSDLEHIQLYQFSSIIRSIERSSTREPGYDIIMHLFQIYEDCTSIVGRYENQDSRIGKLLLDNGIQNIDAALDEYLQKALERLKQTVQVFLKTLPEIELQKETRIINWLEKSKSEIHPDKKLGVFMEFFVTFDK